MLVYISAYNVIVIGRFEDQCSGMIILGKTFTNTEMHNNYIMFIKAYNVHVLIYYMHQIVLICT